jgi:hypothetical protein
MTSHYGRWRLHPSWGWVWYPGRHYSPAHVYWFWGPEWVGWVPNGYYGHHSGAGPFYGYAGGPWSYYRDWTFCPTSFFGRRDGHRFYYSGREMPARSGRQAVPRGVLASETRGLGRVEWRDGEAVARELLSRADEQGRRVDLTEVVAGRVPPPHGRREVVRWASPRPDSGSGGPLSGYGGVVEPRSALPRLPTDADPPVRRVIERLRAARELRERAAASSAGETRPRPEPRSEARSETRSGTRSEAPRRGESVRPEAPRRPEPGRALPRSRSGDSRDSGAARESGSAAGKRDDAERSRAASSRRPPPRERPQG